VQASPYSFDSKLESHSKLQSRLRRLWLAVAGACLCALAACATVRPEDKEYLAEPSMTWTNTTFAARHQAHVVDNREGSTGGSQTKGGGCGCN
jgi:hypothetical protein